MVHQGGVRHAHHPRGRAPGRPVHPRASRSSPATTVTLLLMRPLSLRRRRLTTSRSSASSTRPRSTCSPTTTVARWCACRRLGVPAPFARALTLLLSCRTLTALTSGATLLAVILLPSHSPVADVATRRLLADVASASSRRPRLLEPVLCQRHVDERHCGRPALLAGHPGATRVGVVVVVVSALPLTPFPLSSLPPLFHSGTTSWARRSSA